MRELKPVFNKVSSLNKTKAQVTVITLRRFICSNTKGNQWDNIQNIVLVEMGIETWTHQKVNVKENNVCGIMQREMTDEQNDTVS